MSQTAPQKPLRAVRRLSISDFGFQIGIGGRILVEQRALVGIENVQIHASCMQIDATLILVLLLIKAHDS